MLLQFQIAFFIFVLIANVRASDDEMETAASSYSHHHGSHTPNQLAKVTKRLDKLEDELSTLSDKVKELEEGRAMDMEKIQKLEASVEELEHINTVWKCNFRAIRDIFIELRKKIAFTFSKATIKLM